MTKAQFLAGACLVVAFVSLGTVSAQGAGIIEGQVVNGTAGVGLDTVAGLEVTLHRLGPERDELVAVDTTDEGGRFRFQDLSADAEVGYRFQLEYRGVTYGADVAFSAGDTIVPIVATVYETTTSDEGIVTTRHHLIVGFGANTLLVQELYVIDNTTDRIYVGGEEGTLRFFLPADATELSVDDVRLRLNTVETDEGFASLLPVAPGQAQVLYSYLLPYDGTGRVLSPKVLYPTGDLDVMIADVGVQGESSDLTYRGLTGGEDTSYLHFEARNLARGAEVQIRLSGAPQLTGQAPLRGTSLHFTLQRLWPWIALALALLGALLAFVQFYLRPGRQALLPGAPSRTGGTGQGDSQLKIQRQELLQLVADLDDAFAEGRITQEGYRELRQSVRSRLTEISRELKGEDRD